MTTTTVKARVSGSAAYIIDGLVMDITGFVPVDSIVDLVASPAVSKVVVHKNDGVVIEYWAEKTEEPK